MELALINHLVYLAISIALTVWVAQTLHRNGRLFLVDAFGGNADMGNAVNHLLRVGFYLVNLGFVALFLSVGRAPATPTQTVETMAAKIGVVLLVLGAMHFFNMWNFSRIRAKSRRHLEPRLPATGVSPIAAPQP